MDDNGISKTILQLMNYVSVYSKCPLSLGISQACLMTPEGISQQHLCLILSFRFKSWWCVEECPCLVGQHRPNVIHQNLTRIDCKWQNTSKNTSSPKTIQTHSMKNSLAKSSEARPLQLDRLRKQTVCCSYHPSIFKTTFFHMVSDGQLSGLVDSF